MLDFPSLCCFMFIFLVTLSYFPFNIILSFALLLLFLLLQQTTKNGSDDDNNDNSNKIKIMIRNLIIARDN